MLDIEPVFIFYLLTILCNVNLQENDYNFDYYNDGGDKYGDDDDGEEGPVYWKMEVGGGWEGLNLKIVAFLQNRRDRFRGLLIDYADMKWIRSNREGMFPGKDLVWRLMMVVPRLFNKHEQRGI